MKTKRTEIEYAKCEMRDFSKLRVVDGMIRYQLYQQDGSMPDMTIEDPYPNRLFVSWAQIHDRYAEKSDATAH